MTKSYTSKDIKVMSEISHIQANCGMYIGETTTPVHLIEECLDNSLDEAIGGYAKIIAINYNKKENTYCVIDNGRGMPIDNDIAITISTKMFSGGKFKDLKTAYEISSGKHGIGLVAVNALSESFIIEIYRDNKHAKYSFENAVLKDKILEDFHDTAPFSTKIQFKPNKKYFERLEADIDKIRRRLLIASVEIESCSFVLNIDKKKEVIKLSKDEFFNKYCLSESDKNINNIIKISAVDGSEKFDINFAYSFEGSATPKVISSVNLLPVENGGTHVNIFFDLIKDIFVARGKKLNLKFNQTDCLCGLRVYFSVYIKEPDLSGQIKDKLINRKEYFTKLTGKLKTQLETYFNNNPEYTDSVLNYFVEYRRRVDSKKLKGESHGRRSATKFTKLRDCTSSNGELFIVEGESAGGGFIDCRDPKVHAIFPLKGKIQSIANAKDIMQNKEVGELIQALGCGTGHHFEREKLKYDKIICAVDADEDGAHIFCLLTMIMASLLPELVKEGKYYLAMTPLYGVTKGKNFLPLWTLKEVEEAIKNGDSVVRYKGLGELSPWKLKICAIDHKTRKLIQIKYTKNIDEMMTYFQGSEKKRDLLNDKNISSV